MEEAQRLASLKVTTGLEKKGYLPLTFLEDEAEIALREDGSCPYLAHQGCDVHREVGGENKPFTCQIFPFGAVNTPEGYFLSTSFSCPAVLLGSGAPLTEQLPELQRLLGADKMYTKKVGRIRLTEDRDITWEEYKTLELELLSKTAWTHPIHTLLMMACWLVLHSETKTVPSTLSPELTESILYQEAVNILPVFAANIISVLENPESDQERPRLLEAVGATGGYPSKLVEGAILPVFKLEEVPNLITQTVLDRYLQGQVFGKRLLVGPTIVTRLLTLVCAVSVLLYYLNLRIESGPGPDMDMGSLEWAFELVEASMVTHAGDMSPIIQEYERALAAYSRL